MLLICIFLNQSQKRWQLSDHCFEKSEGYLPFQNPGYEPAATFNIFFTWVVFSYQNKVAESSVPEVTAFTEEEEIISDFKAAEVTRNDYTEGSIAAQAEM